MLLEDPEDPALPLGIDGRCMKFDLVVSHLALHHIADHASLLRTLHGCLKPGGRVALTDFEDFGPEARRFHPEGKMSDVEHQYGIKAERFACLMREAGFEDVSVAPAWTMDKEVETYPGEWGPKGLKKLEGNRAMIEKIDFPFLPCTGTKKCSFTNGNSHINSY
jgi:SAM-dependent methyltransferase